MAGSRIKPVSPASGSVTVSVVDVPNCPRTSPAARMRSTGGSGGGSGAMLISIAAGMGGTAAGDTTVSYRGVASGPGPGCETFVPGVRPLPKVTRGDWNDVKGPPE